MNFENDNRIVMTLDAGGTNFVFSAVKGYKEIINPITTPSHGDNLNECLTTIINGFQRVKEELPYLPSAISFAFPGPADYPRGIIGDLNNLPAFRNGVALGPMLEMEFNIPVYINNDGDLFAFGEAIAGFLPYINSLLSESGSPKRFKNLLGITLGTGFGGGIVRDGKLFMGDNSGAGEIWLLRNKLNPSINAEEGASIRAVQKVYAELANISIQNVPSPKNIFEIALGMAEGNKEAALTSYRRMAEVVGDALANAITLIDGLIVIGGGISGASSLFMPSVVNEMNSYYVFPDGKNLNRLAVKVFNLEDENELNLFLKGDKREIVIPQSDNKKITYDPLSRIGVGISKLGTSRAVSIGAYAFALSELDKNK